MMIYRDKVTVSGTEIRANVYVLSTGTKLRNGADSGINWAASTVATVSLSPAERAKLSDRPTIWLWKGGEYYLQGNIIPIVALGRVDHYEATVMHTIAGG